jgi:hypothetical protein
VAPLDRCPGLSLLALEQPFPFDVLPPGDVLLHSPQVSHLRSLKQRERIRLPRCGRRGFRLLLVRWPDLFALPFADRIIGLHFSCGLPLCLALLRLESPRRSAMLLALHLAREGRNVGRSGFRDKQLRRAA